MKAIFQEPWLVQRLNKPANWIEQKDDFEKGLIVNKGLCEKVGKVFEQIMSFDYMGSAEFEWGALPKSLEVCIEYAKDNNLMACEIDVVSKKGNVKPVYYICHSDIEDGVLKWIKKVGFDNFHHYCKESVRLEDAIDEKEYSRCGWYDLENRFWFFTDRKMFLNVKKLFSV